MLKYFFVAFLLVIAHAELFNRQCRSLEEYGGAVRDFDYPAYKGNWYQIERFDFLLKFLTIILISINF